MQHYIGVKFVQAMPMTAGEFCQTLQPDHPGINAKEDEEGYAVTYIGDGYRSWCPKEAFEAANRPINALTFGYAIEAAKKGHKIARMGWNGKGMFLYYVPANSYPAQTEAAKSHFGAEVPYGAYLAMKTAQGNVVPWLASQTDVLAEDWVIEE